LSFNSKLLEFLNANPEWKDSASGSYDGLGDYYLSFHVCINGTKEERVVEFALADLIDTVTKWNRQ
jgi:hypothetical protein